MCYGLPISALPAFEPDLLPDWRMDPHVQMFQAITGAETTESIAPLQPDILGEHFVLEVLAAKSAFEDQPATGQPCGRDLNAAQRQRLVHDCWRQAPLQMAGFAIRAHRDLPRHESLRLLIRPINEPGYPELVQMSAGLDLVLVLGGTDPQAAHLLLNDIRTVAQSRNEAVHWDIWSKVATNLMFNLSKSDADAARTLLDDMRTVAQMCNDPPLWVEWIHAGTILMSTGLGSRDPKAAVVLLYDMRAVAQTRNEPPLWEAWAQAAFNLSDGLRKIDLISAHVVHDGFRAVAEGRNEAPLWEKWAEAAFNFVKDLCKIDSAAARTLLDDMHMVAQTRNDAVLWVLWAKAAFSLLKRLHESNTTMVRTLLDEMRTTAKTRNDSELWEVWARGALALASSQPTREAFVDFITELQIAGGSPEDKAFSAEMHKLAAFDKLLGQNEMAVT